MEIRDNRIDAGKAFDWGRTSKEYARYRDIYPEEFYRKIVNRGLCVRGQRVLDIGTGTGQLPRNLYSYGAEWTGTDISPEQIDQAKAESQAVDGSLKQSDKSAKFFRNQMKFILYDEIRRQFPFGFPEKRACFVV